MTSEYLFRVFIFISNYAMNVSNLSTIPNFLASAADIKLSELMADTS